ncbi:hypothetical protein L6164_027013 [Bauhinia variegata]|uniref:Uncharacterized protein n=1 Tax=Bauhinia variegata TaxID=167791 RepID=A0ACB9LRQ2_BAUVA|nr:hypothetical protein L6164_027013 [Bauhinia variegata]
MYVCPDHVEEQSKVGSLNFSSSGSAVHGHRNWPANPCGLVKCMTSGITLFGLPTNLIGESAPKVIEFQQMHLPMCFMSVIGAL